MSKSRPLIGITTSAGKNRLMWLCTRLNLALANARAVRITPATSEPWQDCDGFVISGGADVDPACYSQPNTHSFNLDPERDALEQDIIRHALAQNKPIMGICRGMQMINIVKGGTLHQNARDFYDGFIPTNSVLGKIFSRRLVRITGEGELCRLFRHSPTLSVNSLHHQAIDKLGEGLEITARDNHNIAQAIEGTDKEENYILGVQWHPEFMLHSRAHRRLFRVLAAYAKAAQK